MPDDGDFLRIPLSHGALVATLSGDHSIGTPMVLTFIELGILRGGVIQNL